MTKDNTAEDGNDGANRDGALMGQCAARSKGQDRTLWSSIVVALRPTGDEEDK